MIFLVIIIACILGVIVGSNAPMISYTYSSYLAIAIIAALDSVFGGIASVINKRFDRGAVFGGSRTKRAKARKCGLGPGPLRPVCFRKGMLKQCPNFQSRSENWQSS